MLSPNKGFLGPTAQQLGLDLPETQRSPGGGDPRYVPPFLDVTEGDGDQSYAGVISIECVAAKRLLIESRFHP